METIAESKTYLREHWEKGCKCPTCGQLVKLYKRKLNSGMAFFLINLYKAGEGWHHARNLMHGSFSMDYAMLRRWGLITEQPNTDETKRTSGFWRITDAGRQFVEETKTVPTRVHIYNDVIVGFSEEHTTIREALGKRFNYNELMSGS